MNIHPNVNIRDEIPPAEIFQLIAFRVALNAVEYYVAFPPSGRSCLPARLDGEDIRLRVNCRNRPLRNSYLESAIVDVRSHAAHRTVVILVLITVHVAQDKAPDANVRQLLRDDASADAFQNRFTVRTQKALPFMSAHVGDLRDRISALDCLLIGTTVVHNLLFQIADLLLQKIQVLQELSQSEAMVFL
jgi:hypothetical protein